MAAAALPQADGPLDERVAAIVTSEILAKGVPSVSVAVMRDGKMLLERAWGIADVEKTVSASASTTYYIGSVTKQFTAALLLKQVERGRLALTDPIGRHLTGLSPEVDAVTIEQLLNHTSGLQRSAATPEPRFENVTIDTLLEMAAGGELVTKPGTTKSLSSAPVRVLPFARIRIFSSIDQSRCGRFGGMTGRLLASCNHRESVCWRRPVSTASCRALMASLPVRRATIFCLNARENGFVTESLPFAPLVNLASERQLS